MLDFFAQSVRTHRDIFLRHPSAFRLLVASLRSKSLRSRACGWTGINFSGEGIKEKENLSSDPEKLLTLFSQDSRTWPEHLQNVMMDYGIENTMNAESIRTVTATRAFQNAQLAVARDKDMYKLGCTIADLILTTEYSVVEGEFRGTDGRSLDVGLPYKRWMESLPAAAKVVRAKGTPRDLDRADILDVKYLITRQRPPACQAFADKCIARNPTIGFFYYARFVFPLFIPL